MRLNYIVFFWYSVFQMKRGERQIFSRENTQSLRIPNNTTFDIPVDRPSYRSSNDEVANDYVNKYNGVTNPEPPISNYKIYGDENLVGFNPEYRPLPWINYSCGVNAVFSALAVLGAKSEDLLIAMMLEHIRGRYTINKTIVKYFMEQMLEHIKVQDNINVDINDIKDPLWVLSYIRNNISNIYIPEIQLRENNNAGIIDIQIVSLKNAVSLGANILLLPTDILPYHEHLAHNGIYIENTENSYHMRSFKINNILYKPAVFIRTDGSHCTTYIMSDTDVWLSDDVNTSQDNEYIFYKPGNTYSIVSGIFYKVVKGEPKVQQCFTAIGYIRV